MTLLTNILTKENKTMKTTHKRMGVFPPFKDDNELQTSINKVRGNLNTAYHWDLMYLLGRLEQTLVSVSEEKEEE